MRGGSRGLSRAKSLYKPLRWPCPERPGDASPVQCVSCRPSVRLRRCSLGRRTMQDVSSNSRSGIEEWLVRVSGIGAREAVVCHLSNRRHIPGHPRCTAKTGDCVKAAVINGAFTCRGLVATKYLEQVLQNELRIFRIFSALGESSKRRKNLWQAIACYITRWRRGHPGRRKGGTLSYTCIQAVRSLHVEDHGGRASESCRRSESSEWVIIDSEGETAFELSVGNLARCRGDSAKQLQVVELRKIMGRKGN